MVVFSMLLIVIVKLRRNQTRYERHDTAIVMQATTE